MTQAITYQDLTGVHAHHLARTYSEPNSIESFLVRPEWQQRAACRGQDLSWWFPDRGTAAPETIAARKLCSSCPVREECLDYAMGHHEYGLWGNTSERQRKALSRGSTRRPTRRVA